MRRYTLWQRGLVALIVITLATLTGPPLALAGAAPPRPGSAYSMDMFGPAWQYYFPRLDGSPHMSAAIRRDLLDRSLRLASEAGVRWNRLTTWWCMVEPERGQWFWDDVDAAVQIGQNYGIESVMTLLYTPYWAVAGAPYAPECPNNRRKNYPPTNMADWENFVRTIARRYGANGKNAVHYWEIWNEPDLPEFLSIENDPGDGTVPVYADMLNRAARIIRAESPGAVILIGGLSDIRGSSFLDKLLRLRGELDIRNSFDIVSLHAYSNHAYKISRIQTVLDAHGLQRPLWNTELNYLGWDYAQAQAGLAGLYQLMTACNVSRSFWFMSYTTRWGPGIFNPIWPSNDPQPFWPSPLYPTFQALAAPFQLPGRPTAIAPKTVSTDQRPRFEWESPTQGSYPIAGYKLSVDNDLFLGAPLFWRPEVDAWVPANALTFLPLVTGGRRAEARGELTLSGNHFSPDTTFGYTPGTALPWGVYYWRVAAVDDRGNVGPYTEPRYLMVRPPISTYLPLVN